MKFRFFTFYASQACIATVVVWNNAICCCLCPCVLSHGKLRFFIYFPDVDHDAFFRIDLGNFITFNRLLFALFISLLSAVSLCRIVVAV